MIRMSFTLLLLCAIFFLDCQAFAQEPLGSVTEFEGTAELFRKKQEFNVVLKMTVLVRDRLQTMPKSHLTVTLHGGSQLILSESSSMVIDEMASNPRGNSSVSLMLGRLRAVVTSSSSR